MRFFKKKLLKRKKILWTLFMDEVQLCQGFRGTTRFTLRGTSLLFTTKSIRVPATHSIDLGRLCQTWSHPVVLNTGSFDWEPSDLTIRPLLQIHNQFHNSLRLFDVLQNFPFTTSETMGDYYLLPWYLRVASRVLRF